MPKSLRGKLWAACFLVWLPFVFSQDSNLITGRVSDRKGAAIPGASVRAADGVESLTDTDGSYRLANLPPGIYSLTVEIAGFLKYSKADIDLTRGSQKIDIVLEPLPRPNPGPAAERTAAKRQTQSLEAPGFQTAEVNDLPGLREFQENIPATESNLSPAAATGDSLLLITGNTASLDSGNMNDPAFRREIMDFAQQMGFQMQNFGPGAGGMQGGPGGPGGPGGGMGGPGGFGGPGGGPGGPGGFARMGSRGGRGANFQMPKIEGNLTETFSNSAFNARSYSLTGETLPKPVQIGDNFGFTLGGVFPFLKGKGGTQTGFGRGRMSATPQWTVSYSGSRNRNPQNILATVPTDLERAGDFSQTYVQVLTVDPKTGQKTVGDQPVKLYSNPVDPSSAFSVVPSINPIAGQLLGFIPHANIACTPGIPCVNNYALERSLPSSSDQLSGSVTGLRLASKDTVGINYSLRRGDTVNAATFPGLDTTRSNFAQNIVLSGNHFFQQRMFANWRVTVNRVRVESSNAFAYNQNVEGDLRIQGVSSDPINWGPPTLSFTSYAGLSLANPVLIRNQTVAGSGALRKVGTKHSLQLGGDVNWAQRNTHSDNNGRGTFSFNGYGTVLLNSQGQQVAGTGYDFADFLLGLPYSTSRQYVNPAINPYGNSVYLRNRSWDMFALDNWRLRSNLTINYGVRYEYVGPFFEKYDRLVNLDANPSFTDVAQVFPNQNGPISGDSYARSIVSPDRGDIAPRIGIAWRLSARSPFVIRAGYGIGYNAGGYASIAGSLVNQSPFAIAQNLVSARSDPLTLQDGFPSSPATTVLNTYGVDPNYKPSYAQQWSLDVQAQLSKLYVLNVTYAGTKGTGLDVLRAPSHDPAAGYFTYLTNGGSSNYNALTARLSRRFSHGFNMVDSYVFSKSIDDAPGVVAQNDANLDAERALSNTDQRHNFSSNLIYELPMGKNRLWFAGASSRVLNFVSGWTINGTVSITSGTPLTARYVSANGSVLEAALYNSLRPDVTGESVELDRGERTVAEFFNTAAFAIPAGPYGDAGRNTITGPGSSLVSLSLRKSFQLDENFRRIDFSWQVNNVFNHPNWTMVSTTINALNFGQVTNVGQMRNMTVNLRVRF